MEALPQVSLVLVSWLNKRMVNKVEVESSMPGSVFFITGLFSMFHSMEVGVVLLAIRLLGITETRPPMSMAAMAGQLDFFLWLNITMGRFNWDLRNLPQPVLFFNKKLMSSSSVIEEKSTTTLLQLWQWRPLVAGPMVSQLSSH